MKTIVTNAGETVEVQDKDDLEAACRYEHIRRFSQSSSTPFLNRHLLKDVELLVEGPGPADMLEGQYFPKEDVDDSTHKFIKELRRPPQVQMEREIGLSLEVHMNGCRKARESTSRETSGLHYGHLVTGCLEPVLARFDWQMRALPLPH